ncbi:hypothetical protein F5879DRAFT_926681 [Lentinula edodes]|nr:hypothetical protein F5879DRAFT_926681 [Lentinula edodes]
MSNSGYQVNEETKLAFKQNEMMINQVISASNKSRKFCPHVWPVEGLDSINFPFKNEAGLEKIFAALEKSYLISQQHPILYLNVDGLRAALHAPPIIALSIQPFSIPHKFSKARMTPAIQFSDFSLVNIIVESYCSSPMMSYPNVVQKEPGYNGNRLLTKKKSKRLESLGARRLGIIAMNTPLEIDNDFSKVIYIPLDIQLEILGRLVQLCSRPTEWLPLLVLNTSAYNYLLRKLATYVTLDESSKIPQYLAGIVSKPRDRTLSLQKVAYCLRINFVYEEDEGACEQLLQLTEAFHSCPPPHLRELHAGAEFLVERLFDVEEDDSDVMTIAASFPQTISRLHLRFGFRDGPMAILTHMDFSTLANLQELWLEFDSTEADFPADEWDLEEGPLADLEQFIEENCPEDLNLLLLEKDRTKLPVRKSTIRRAIALPVVYLVQKEELWPAPRKGFFPQKYFLDRRHLSETEVWREAENVLLNRLADL